MCYVDMIKRVTLVVSRCCEETHLRYRAVHVVLGSLPASPGVTYWHVMYGIHLPAIREPYSSDNAQ